MIIHHGRHLGQVVDAAGNEYDPGVGGDPYVSGSIAEFSSPGTEALLFLGLGILAIWFFSARK
jgi:hypothetical protein